MDATADNAESKTLDLLIAEMMKIINADAIDPDVGIGELGFDSLKVVELILVCDQLYSGDIEPDKLDVSQFTTLRDLDRQLRELSETAS